MSLQNSHSDDFSITRDTREIYHALVLDMHQPSGNLEHLLDAHEWEAKEILFAYDRMPRSLWGYEDVARVNVAFSGTLLETLSNPDFQRRVYGIVKCGDLLHSLQNTRLFEALGTGYYHPLFALIPEADWDEQITRWRECVRALFGSPRGFWPPDLAFDMRLIPHLKRAGYRYVIVDSEYVRPLDPMSWHELRYRPHVAEYGGEEIIVVVRDRDLSKAQLAGMDYDWFYRELLDRTRDCTFPPLVTTATPGDNGGWFRNVDEEANFWGHCYRPALDAVRSGLSLLRPTFINDYLDRFGAHGRVTVERGAWNTEQHHGFDFTQWQGSQAQRDTMARLHEVSGEFHRARAETADGRANAEVRRVLDEAHWRLLRAETGCNFFWGDAWLPKAHKDLDDVRWLLGEARVLLGRALSDADRRMMLEHLSAESAANAPEDAIRELIGLLHKQLERGFSGAENELTAKPFQIALAKLMAFFLATSEQQRLVGGQVRREDDQSLRGSWVRAFHLGDQGPLRLGEDTLDAEGCYTIRYTGVPGADAIHLRVVVFDAESQPLRESELIRDAKPLEIVNLVAPAMPGVRFQVSGKVASRFSAGVGGLHVCIVDKNVGEDVQLAEAVTDDSGTYQATFTDASLRRRDKARPDLQARVFVGDTVLAASEVRYNAANRETLDVMLGEQARAALRSEYDTLTGTLFRHFKGKLGDLKETDERQDITYLANKTGWDARAVALAALADQFSARTARDGAEIKPAFFYALFRAGLPANEDALYHADVKTVEAIWKQAITQGVIPAGLEDTLPGAIERYQKLAVERVLDGPALVGLSSLKEMLSSSLGDDAQRQKKFADFYTRHRNDPPQLWEAVRGAFGEAAEKRLKLDAQLAHLTLNNAPLIRKLHAAGGEHGLTDTLSLVANGYYRADDWRDVIGDDPIPPEITGENESEKRNRYAELLAAQVRLSFPTAVVAQMIANGETPLAENGLKNQVHEFLMRHQGEFDFGTQSVEQFVARNDLQIDEKIINEIKRIKRVYQITPGDDAMNALLSEGLDSAAAVVRHDQEEFVEIFKSMVGGETNARLIHAKSEQVHNAVLNIIVSYRTAKNMPAIGWDKAAKGSDQDTWFIKSAPSVPANAADVPASATLEKLFGEMDYCACEHCRSILSPAAYLVDLLNFCDDPDAGYRNPQAVLFGRRPDIQHLPLTCENTNIPLPYIDLVNEILEHYITDHLSLTNYKGHTIDGSATPEELLANPQFVSDKAYEILAGKPVPAGDPPLLPPTPLLPFHQSLENLRRYFSKFEAPLPKVMAALRKNDDLDRPNPADPANPVEYGWRDILMEELRLSRAEYALLTDRKLTLRQLYGYPPATSDEEVLTGLSNARAFTRRVGISYEDLIEILKTRFVNPNSTLIPKLERLGASFAELKKLKDTPPGSRFDDEFDALLPSGLDLSNYGGDVKSWVRNQENYQKIMDLIILTAPNNPDDDCRFDNLFFRYTDPAKIGENIRPFEFVRLIRFIRLWKKLGWTVAQTDKAITALYPLNQIPNDPNDAVNLQRLDDGFLLLLPRLGVIEQVKKALKLTPKKDLLSLLACFAPIDTHGAASLYRQMFLSPVLLKQDEAFADKGYGDFLTDPAPKLMAHAETLRAAFQLTGDELSEIGAALEFDDNTPLTLDRISDVYRRGWLARKLKLSVREFLSLTRFTGIDPFTAPDPIDPPILRFIELMNRLGALSMKPTQVLYLIWNQDISGISAPSEAQITGFCRTLRADLAAIQSEFAPADDPDGQVARARMGLVYGNDASDLFFGLLGNNLVTDVPYDHDQATLEQAILDAAPGRIAYDDFRKRLSFTGVLSTSTRDTLKATPRVTSQFQAAVDNLYDQNQKVVGPFFARYPELPPLYEAYVTSNDPAEKKRSDLLANFLPALKDRRKRQQTLQAISAAVSADTIFAGALLNDSAVLHAAKNIARPALDDLTALETPGLSARFFFPDPLPDPLPNPDRTSDAEANLAYSSTLPNKLPDNGGNPISGIWSGYLEVPENGFYNFHIEADAGATVALNLGGETIRLAPNGNVWSNIDPIELRAGTLYAISVQVGKIKDTLIVRWETAGRGREIIPARYLYSATLTDHLRHVYVRFLKAASLATVLKLTAAETAYFTSHADYGIGGQGWLNSLPVTGNSDRVMSIELFNALNALLDFARIKTDLSPGDERLLTVLKNPKAKTHAENSESLFLTLTRWKASSLESLLVRFFGNADWNTLKELTTFCRVYDAYAWVNKLDVPASALIKATTNEPNATTVRDLQAALRARFDESNWLSVLKPINDEMRGLQRNALVAYILHQMRENPASAHIDTPEKLFEYFLMDVQMEPCMQTSRVRHALLSVQLFIERCLMNLESSVNPSTIDAKQWEWMKRYRVWEANRKVFLYPENWLEPELRDDQSPFFKEAMSELLQGDITEDRAATTFLNYLSKLDEVAKLELCGIHYVENDPDEAQDDVAHVVARTAGANRKYFYRRREYGYWTPWEQIKLDIEDNPVIPVVWKGRLFLFWLRILKQGPDPTQLTSSSGPIGDDGKELNFANLTASQLKENALEDAKTNTRITVQAVLCWSECYNGKWQTTKTSDINKPITLVPFYHPDNKLFDRSALRLRASEAKGGLQISIFNDDISNNINNYLNSFFLFNTHSLPVCLEDLIPLKDPDYDLILRDSTFLYIILSNNTLTIEWLDASREGRSSDYHMLKIKCRIPQELINITQPYHELCNRSGAPFFYEDSRHVFYITTDVSGWPEPIILSKSEFNAEMPPVASVIDSSPTRRYLVENRYVAKGISSIKFVRYGDAVIGPAGNLANENSKR